MLFVRLTYMGLSLLLAVNFIGKILSLMLGCGILIFLAITFSCYFLAGLKK